ncbi:MAG: hypothetical protein HYS12_22170 [Planctomycetes bacterium]|nr:hypothetical protein [Planctomycetota bacterium]
MPIAAQCPNCASNFKAPDAAAGKRVKCPECHQPFTVPTAPKPTEMRTVKRPRTPVQPIEVEPADDFSPSRPKRRTSLVWALAAVWGGVLLLAVVTGC